MSDGNWTDRYCNRRGSAYPQAEPDYPKICTACGGQRWLNPTPVSILIQPVSDPENNRIGVLVGMRSAGLAVGEWGLPGGFMELGETVEEAAVRELVEETRIVVDPANCFVRATVSNAAERHVLIFCEAFKMLYLETLKIASFVATDECSELDVAFEPRELAFRSHTEQLRAWLAEQNS